MHAYKKITVISLLFLAVIFLVPNIAHAQFDFFGINDFADGNVNLGTRPLEETIAGYVNIALGFLGILATLLLLYGGFVWMTSRGQADKIDRAKRIIMGAIIGLAIILISFAVVRFVLNAVLNGPSGGTGGPGGPGGPGYSGGTGLGAGVLESHYPGRNQQDVPRNTNIFITFNEPMNEVFINTGCTGVPSGYDGCINATYIKIFDETNPGSPIELPANEMFIKSDAADRSYEINPYGNTGTHLGSQTAPTPFKVVLDGLQTQNNQPAFPITGFYNWNFTVGTTVDTTPPTVVSVIPALGASNVPINSTVQINFSEPINPSFAAGIEDSAPATSWPNIMVADNGLFNNPVSGEYRVANQYYSVDFTTDNFCGQNSCGMDVYCLPGSTTVFGRATTLIQDMAGNTLAADYDWSFSTAANVDLTPPVISDMSQGIGSNFSLSAPVQVTFDKPLLPSSVNSLNVFLNSPAGPINYWTSMPAADTININHDPFLPLTTYNPELTAGIMDTLQNCWYPCECDDPTGLSCRCNNNVSGTQCPGANCSNP